MFDCYLLSMSFNERILARTVWWIQIEVLCKDGDTLVHVTWSIYRHSLYASNVSMLQIDTMSMICILPLTDTMSAWMLPTDTMSKITIDSPTTSYCVRYTCIAESISSANSSTSITPPMEFYLVQGARLTVTIKG